MFTAKELITEYDLMPHPEGGYYKETYRSNDLIPQSALPIGFSGDRFIYTAIYFLLEQGNFSAFHRIKSDECWHFYYGDTLIIYILYRDGSLKTIHLGNNIFDGELFQFVVPANCWFASRPAKISAFSLVGCTVAPGFDFNDFELAKAGVLSEKYPEHKGIIGELCRE